jgi:glucokinase
MKDTMILGIDIGGSHITAALVEESKRQINVDSIRRLRVNSNGSADEILNVWSSVVNDIFNSYDIIEKRIGIAMPGPFDYDNGISQIKGLDKYDTLYGLNVKELLAKIIYMPTTNILMMNDAACFLRGEVYYGAAKGFDDAIGITLGTGTGSAFHHNGITTDANLGPSPFKSSIADDYFSTRWFVKRYKEVSSIHVNNVKELAEFYATDNKVKVLFSEFTDNLSDFLEVFIHKEKPQVVVLGGNIVQCSNLFLADLMNNLKVRGINTAIVTAKLGEEAAILGAVSLFNK